MNCKILSNYEAYKGKGPDAWDNLFNGSGFGYPQFL